NDRYPVNTHIQKDLDSFVTQWWSNIREQGFPAAAPKLHNVTEQSSGRTPEKSATQQKSATEHNSPTVQKAPGELATDPHITAGKNERSEPMNDKSEKDQSKTPAWIVDAGSVKAHIWAHQGKHGEHHSITFVRVYMDKESGTEK